MSNKYYWYGCSYPYKYVIGQRDLKLVWANWERNVVSKPIPTVIKSLVLKFYLTSQPDHPKKSKSKNICHNCTPATPDSDGDDDVDDLCWISHYDYPCWASPKYIEKYCVTYL